MRSQFLPCPKIRVEELTLLWQSFPCFRVSQARSVSTQPPSPLGKTAAAPRLRERGPEAEPEGEGGESGEHSSGFASPPPSRGPPFREGGAGVGGPTPYLAGRELSCPHLPSMNKA